MFERQFHDFGLNGHWKYVGGSSFDPLHAGARQRSPTRFAFIP